MSQTDIKKSRSRRLQTARRRRRNLFIANVIMYALLVFVVLITAKNIKSDKKALRNEGVELYMQGSYDEAVSKFDEALKEKQWFAGKLNADICLYRAESLSKSEKYAEAARAYREALDYKYKSFMKKSRIEELIDINEALFKYSCGEYNACLDAFVKAVENGHEELSIFAALCCDKKGDLENMKKYMDIYTQKYGYTSFLYYQTAVYHIKNGDADAAASYIEDGLSLDDDSHRRQLEYLKIAALKKDKNFKEAYRLAADYVNKYPDDAEGKKLYEYLDTRVNADPNPINNIYGLYYDDDYENIYEGETGDKESTEEESEEAYDDNSGDYTDESGDEYPADGEYEEY